MIERIRTETAALIGRIRYPKAVGICIIVIAVIGCWCSVRVYRHDSSTRHRARSVYANGSQIRLLRLPAVHIAAGSKTTFAPFTRAEVVAVTLRWRFVKPVAFTSNFISYSSRYEAWKKKALAQFPVPNAENAVAAKNWILGYESRQRHQFIVDGVDMPESGSTAPSCLITAAGAPPTAFRGDQNRYDVTLPGVASHVVLKDHPLDQGSKFLLYPEGVMRKGQMIDERPLWQIRHLARMANLSPDELVVFLKVSEREGGFEAVNTYDAGYLSVGFIQFAAMKSGAGSLVSVMERMKEMSPSDFSRYFRYYGVDFDRSKHLLVVIDPVSGKVLEGADATEAVRQDKRLTAVFYHAGSSSEVFQAAQLKQAAQQYYAPDHTFSLSAAKVIDYSNPWSPVTTYYYGDADIQTARQLVDHENAIPWTPPAPEPIPSAPPLSVLPAPAPPKESAPSNTPPASEPTTTASPAASTAEPVAQTALPAASGSPKNGTASTNAPVQTPAGASSPNAPVPLPYVSGAPTSSQIKHSSRSKQPRSVEFAEAPYKGSHYRIVRLPSIEGKYGDIFRSQAGKVAITDRCIQRGFATGASGEGLSAKFTRAVSLVSGGSQITIDKLAQNERALILVVQNRILTLADHNLSQPPTPSRNTANTGDSHPRISTSRSALRPHLHSLYSPSGIRTRGFANGRFACLLSCELPKRVSDSPQLHPHVLG